MEKAVKTKVSRKRTTVRRQEIIDAGMRILTTEGARQFTAERLGEEVGITSGTIFRHFQSMEEILDGIVDRIEEIIFTGFPPQATDPLERLRLFFEARIRTMKEHPEVSRLLLTTMLIPNGNRGGREKRLREFKLRSRRFVADCLKKAKADGLLAEDVSSEDSSVLVLGAIYAIGHMGIDAKSIEESGKLAERVWRMLERSLTRRA